MTKRPRVFAFFWRHTLRVSSIRAASARLVSTVGGFLAMHVASFVASLGELEVLEVQGLLMEVRTRRRAGVFPGRHIGELLVVAKRLPVLGLTLLAEMTATSFCAMERVDAYK